MMHQSITVLVLVAMTGTSRAVFYTKGSDNDYPRIGRRNFFTAGNGNHYPRIGRRDAAVSQFLLPGLEFADLPTYDKRGIFTQGAHGSYPRVGRGGEHIVGGEDFLNERNKLLGNIAGAKGEIEESEGANGENSRLEESGHSGLPLDIMFIAFDLDSDGKLSKDEFTSGLGKYRQHCTLF